MRYSMLAVLSLGSFVLYFVVTKVIRYFQIRSFSKAHGCKAVKNLPQSDPIFGYDFFKLQVKAAISGNILSSGLERFNKHGKTHKVVMMGTSLIVTTEPENVKAILSTNFRDYGLGGRLKVFGPLLGSGIFTTDGAHWEHSRALIRPSFVKTQVADLASLETFIQNMIKKIPRDGATVDLQPLLFQLTLDSSTDFLFGESVNILLSPEGSEQQLFAAAFDYARTQLGRRARLGAFLWTYRDADFVLACKRVHNFVDGFVYKALEYRKGKDSGQTDEKSSGKYVFLNELAEATNDPKRLRDELLNVLLAGRDTTAGLLSSIFHVLARRQDVWEKLQDEVALLHGKQPDYETLRNMKYLRNVLNETLRLWPIVPLNSRFAVRDTVLPVGGGPDGLSPIFVGAGQIVNWSLYSMHRRKDLWGTDAGEFRPERWREKTAVRIGWGYLPFNGGPRICVGQQFALTEASYTVVRLLQEFKGIENRDRQPWIEAFAVTLASRHGTKVAMVPR